ncbi:MAG: ubiquinol-cytochrome c reductase iron-sulfur subunit [Dehalococcoidia bacterium]
MNDERRRAGSAALRPHRNSLERLRAEFPYHWDADALVNRRELLQLAVLASGALFAGTAILALLGRFREARRGEPTPAARVSEVAEGEAHYFEFPASGDQAVLLHLPGGRFVAYSQVCTHLACSVYFQAEKNRLFCPCHEGVFDPETGEPTAGPPARRLPRIVLQQEGDTLIAVEEVP